jgi:2-polyprenyl-3-methyl-5-hydroxy-6-metoxy-1,4-benzoquinol methylase
MAEKFDAYAESYEKLHGTSIKASGEDPAYFHQYKIECLARLSPRVPKDGPVLDFGCGIGNLTERLVLAYDEVHGYDPSKESVETAKSRADKATFHTDVEGLPRDHFATAVLSGVLHHVPVAERKDLLGKVRATLRPGGRIVVFEHNPLNPLTRRAVSTCEFDDDAILLYPWEARKLLAASGFEDVALDYIVFFPKPLAFLRPIEPSLRWFGIGAQQMLVAKR